VQWVRRYIHFHDLQHPSALGKDAVEAFLTLSALLFLYKEVLGVNLPWMAEVTRAKKPARLPTVLTQDEVRRLLK